MYIAVECVHRGVAMYEWRKCLRSNSRWYVRASESRVDILSAAAISYKLFLRGAANGLFSVALQTTDRTIF